MQPAGRDAAAAHQDLVKDAWDLIVDPFFVTGPQDIGLGWRVLDLAAARGHRLRRSPPSSASRSAPSIGQSVWAMRGLDPIFQVLRTMPPLAWLPISLAAFRDSQPSAIFVIFITAIWPIIINTAVGIRNIPQDYRNVARVLRLNPFEFFFKIMMPSAAPYIFTGLRIGIGLSWLAIVAAEMLTGGVGIGFFIWDAWNSSRISDIVVALVYIGGDRLPARPAGGADRQHRHARHRRQLRRAMTTMSYLEDRPRRQDLHAAAPARPRCSTDITVGHRAGRVRLHHRPLRLRQVHPAQHRRRPHAGDERARCCSRTRR